MTSVRSWCFHACSHFSIFSTCTQGWTSDLRPCVTSCACLPFCFVMLIVIDDPFLTFFFYFYLLHFLFFPFCMAATYVFLDLINVKILFEEGISFFPFCVYMYFGVLLRRQKSLCLVVFYIDLNII